MKKLIFGVLALVVPMTLVSYTMHFVGNIVVTILGIMTMCAMVAYTVNKFRLIGHRGYKNMTNSLGYASLGNVCWTFGYMFSIFCGAKIFVNGFNPDPCRFIPLVALIVYMCGLGIIACIICLLKEKKFDMDRKALMVFISMFLLCIAIGCCSEIFKIMQDTESLSIVLILSAGGASVAKYRLTKHNGWEYA